MHSILNEECDFFCSKNSTLIIQNLYLFQHLRPITQQVSNICKKMSLSLISSKGQSNFGCPSLNHHNCHHSNGNYKILFRAVTFWFLFLTFSFKYMNLTKKLSYCLAIEYFLKNCSLLKNMSNDIKQTLNTKN